MLFSKKIRVVIIRDNNLYGQQISLFSRKIRRDFCYKRRSIRRKWFYRPYESDYPLCVDVATKCCDDLQNATQPYVRVCMELS